MIPIQLTVQGLYSYKDSQTIDFEQLTTSQLFGIFGTVGSGKSSILEAIVFALYDRSERLNKSGDNRYYNMLNLQSKQLVIDFVFQVTSPALNKYRFTVTAQRKKKDYESVEIKERRHYHWHEDEWRPLEVSDASSLIGMTYENFMQTVIIPQGKFREFIDQKPNDRTQMLKELFRLEKFDLSFKTGHLLKAVQSQITDTEARLSEIGQVTAEAIDATRQEVQELEISLHQNAALLQKAEADCQSYEQLRKLFTEREMAQELRLELLNQQADFQTKEKQLKECREAEQYFNEKFASLANTTTELSQARDQLERVIRELTVSQQRANESKKSWDEAKAAYQDRERMRMQCHDLEHLIRICQARAAEPALVSQEQEARLACEQIEKNVTETKRAIKEVENQLQEAEQTQEQQATLREVARWCQQKQEYETEHRERQHRTETQQLELDEITQRKQKVLTEHQWTENGTFEHFYQHFDTKKIQLKDEMQRVVQELSGLQVRSELVGQAQQLSPGDSCPLCGSTHHPSVAHAESLTASIKVEEQALDDLQKQEESLSRLEAEMRQLHNEYQRTAGTIESTKKEFQALELKLEAHQAAFRWKEYQQHSAEDILQLAQQQGQQETRQKQLRQERNQQQQQLDKAEASLTGARAHWQQAQQALIALQSKIENDQSLLKHLTYERYQRFTEVQLKESLDKGQTKLQEVETRHESAREHYQQCEKEVGILEAKREAGQALVSTLQTRAESLENEIQALCGEKEFDSVDYVKSLIDLELDQEAVHEEILTYKNRLHAAEESYQKLCQATQDQHYDASQHQNALATGERLRQENKELQHAWAVAQREIKEQQQKLEKVRQLDQTLVVQKRREDNLKELASLFRGSGFVNYASTVLLEEVCRAANVRFKQLTKNNLSLELNGNNDFIVRDYLNNGRTRLLKTLSGGQTFQAALCLALALAENIKSLNQSQQSFFFLDEGFGSLDKNSLRVVFDTLKSLRQENRVVGIISHVEELQQEIDVYLKIEHDKERGSLVKGSWE